MRTLLGCLLAAFVVGVVMSGPEAKADPVMVVKHKKHHHWRHHHHRHHWHRHHVWLIR